MGIHELIKKIMNDFFIITTGILIAFIAYICLYQPELSLHAVDLITIVFSGLITSMLSIVFYSNKELSKKQMIIRQVIHFILLEVLIVGSAFRQKDIDKGDYEKAVSIFLVVFIIYLAVRIRSWLFDKKDADKINEKLKSYHNDLNL